MSSLLFYLLIALIFITIVFLFYYQRKKKNRSLMRKNIPLVNFDPPQFTRAEQPMIMLPPIKEAASILDEAVPMLDNQEVMMSSPYDPNLIVLQIGSFPGKPYIGYELHQALLSAGLRFGENNIFHRYEEGSEGKILFSLGAATANGSFMVEDMGSFKCNGLLLFMKLNAKQKLMPSFDLMLDTARQLAEELGGEIYDDLHQAINVDVIKRLREKICKVETNNLYVSDLLDNLD